MLEKFRGVILGTAIGDTLGAPFELKPAVATQEIIVDLIKKHGMTKAGLEIFKQRSWTDDTHLTVCHSRSLIRKGHFCPEDTAKELAENGLKRQGAGSATRFAIGNLQNGVPWNKSGQSDPAKAAGNGPAMKISPLALFYHHDLDKLREVCEQASLITHNCPESFAGARAIAFIIAKNLRNELNPQRIIFETIDYIGASDTANKLLKVSELLIGSEKPHKALKEIGTGCYIVETVGASVYCFLKFLERPHIGILRSILAGGDTDTTAAITGALHGSYSGTSKLPKMWYEEIEASDQLFSLSGKLFEAWDKLPK